MVSLLFASSILKAQTFFNLRKNSKFALIHLGFGLGPQGPTVSQRQNFWFDDIILDQMFNNKHMNFSEES